MKFTEHQISELQSTSTPYVAPKSRIIKKKSTQVKAQIIYGYDPLCGWCYGFSDELRKAFDTIGHIVDFKLLNAGIFAGNYGLKMGYISKHIKKNLGNVSLRSNKKFGEKFISLLENTDYPYDSKKASVAVSVIKEMAPHKVFDFASQIQTAFFLNGEDIQNDNTYLKIIEKYNIDSKLFIKKLNDLEYIIKTEKEFLEIKKYNFTGYPASVIKIGSGVETLSQGYMSSADFISKILNKINFTD